MKVTKRSGEKAPLDLEKFHNMVQWAIKDIKNVSASEIELKSSIQFFDGIKTSDIHKITTKAMANLISKRTPNYQFAAARSLLMEVRKEVFGQFEPKPLLETIKKNIKLGFYENLLKYYTEEEIDYLDSKINHSKDFNYTYAGLRTCIDSYTVKNKGTLIESPQQINMLVPMVMFKEEKEERLQQVINYYNDLSDFYISLPSPFMSGLRTKIKGYSSCCLIDSGDTKESLTAANSAAVIMSTVRAGIGMHNGSVRGIGAWVNKTMKHTGITQILKWMQGAVKAFSQPNRGGAMTSHHAVWNWEIEKIINLKSNKATEENSVKHIDYGIGFPNLFFERVKNNEDWTLFSSEETRDLYNNLYDTELWEETYKKYEKKSGIRKKKVNARKLLKDYAVQYFETGRIYPVFLSNANEKSPLKVPLFMANLCLEVILFVKPLKSVVDPDGEIALCILSNINAGKLKSLEQLPRLAKEIVRGLDNVIDIQEYPLPAAETSAINNRYLGIGVSDWAHYLTRKKVKYDTQEALDLAEEFAEKWQYELLIASNELAKERGEAKFFRERSKYADGWLPNDGKWKFIPKEKWEELREDIKKYGLRHLTLSAIPPSATSSDISNSTSGIDMPKDFVITKLAKSGAVPQVVPNFSKGSSYYTLTSEIDNKKYLDTISKFQLYNDQSISTNLNWSKKDFDKTGKFPIKKLIQAIIYANKIGLKSLYYSNFLEEDSGTNEIACAGGGCEV